MFKRVSVFGVGILAADLRTFYHWCSRLSDEHLDAWYSTTLFLWEYP